MEAYDNRIWAFVQWPVVGSYSVWTRARPFGGLLSAVVALKGQLHARTDKKLSSYLRIDQRRIRNPQVIVIDRNRRNISVLDRIPGQARVEPTFIDETVDRNFTLFDILERNS